MSKKDTLKFAVKQSLVVGTATATLGAAACGGGISNPVPERDDVAVNPGDASDEKDAGNNDVDAGDTGDTTDVNDDTTDTNDGSDAGNDTADGDTGDDAGGDTGDDVG